MLKRIFLALLLLALAAGGAMLYLTRQATELPVWYQGEAEALPEPDAMALPPPLPARALPPTGFDPPAAGETRQLRLDERQLNELVQRHLDARPDGRRARRATKAIHASLDGDRLTIGAITDVDRLRAAAETEKERAAIRKLTRLAPFLRGRDFHVAVAGRPRAAGGELALDDVTLTVGRLSFAPEDLLDAFGVDRREVAVRLPDMELEQARVENEMLWLRLRRP